MKKSIYKIVGFPSIIFGILLLGISIPFHSCEPDDTDNIDSMVVYKPNIYLYPIERTALTVKLSFPLGGAIIKSIPEYSTGWNIIADTSGLINDKYGYLFYESVQPDVWQLSRGWSIKKSDLNDFFLDNMQKYGFNDREIKDFLDYWIPRLTDYGYYEIYPQDFKIINSVIKLEINKNPDTALRLFYLIKGVNTLTNLKIPSEPSVFIRSGFCATEWGVILK